MAYYTAGDYYRGGGYYHAGGLGGFLKGIARSAVKVGAGAVGGLIKGGPLGAITGAARGAITAGRSNVVAQFNEQQAGTGTGITPAMAAAHAAALARGPQRQLGAGHQKQLGAGGGFGFAKRRMNTLNAKALSRATRRIKGFEKHAKHSLAVLGLHVSREHHARHRGK